MSLLAEVGDDPLARVRSHVKKLDEYLLRWLGFCRLETAAPESLTDNALFLVVEAASRVARKDLARLEIPRRHALRGTWLEYEDSLIELRKCPQTIKAEAEQTYRKFKAFTDALGDFEKR